MTRKFLLLATAAVLLQAAPASAQSAADWSGPYIGVHVGGAWGNTETRDVDQYNLVPNDHWSDDTSGFVGGAHLGYNALLDNFLVGIEGDLGYLGFDGSEPTDIATFNHDLVAKTRGGIYFTARGRLGVVVNNWLVYGTGGLIGVDMRSSVVDTCATGSCGLATISATKSGIRTGWTVGGGLEVPILPSVTLRGEYLFFDMGDETLRGTYGSSLYRFATSTDGQMIRVGLTWRFFGLRS
jgi:outer membrane immunogenic protein